MATPVRTPGSSTRVRALGFAPDSDSDDDHSPALGSTQRLALRFGYQSATVSSASRIRSRELAAARTFREASREKATLKQHCDSLEEKVRLLERSLSETVRGEDVTAPGDTETRSEYSHVELDGGATRREDESAAYVSEIATLKSELRSATENHEWLRSALEARTCAASKSEREKQGLQSKVTELTRIVDESEACLRDSQIEREAHKARYRKKNAAATAQRLAAEATAAMLRGEVQRMKARHDKNHTSHVMSKLSVHVVDCASSPTHPSQGKVADASDAEGDDDENDENEKPNVGTPGARLQDDSAMGARGGDDGESETVSKPARSKNGLELTSPAAAIVFEYTQTPAKVSGFRDAKSRSPTFLGGFDMDASDVVRHVLVCAQLLASNARAVSGNAASARAGSWTCKNVAANVLYSTAVTACVFSVMCASNFLSPATTFGVRMGSVIATHKKSLSWLQWLAEVISFGVHTGINRAGVAV